LSKSNSVICHAEVAAPIAVAVLRRFPPPLSPLFCCVAELGYLSLTLS
jgi:hypothetical protein